MEQKIGNDTGRSQVNAESFLEELKPLIEDFLSVIWKKGKIFCRFGLKTDRRSA